MNQIKDFFLNPFKEAFQNFLKNQNSLRAAGLSFYTLTSIVPVLAIIFGIAHYLDLDDLLEIQLKAGFSYQKEIIDHIIYFSRKLFETKKSSIIAAFGSLALLWTSFSILNIIERTLNQILEIKNDRTLLQKIRDYFILITICPLIFIGASALNIFLFSKNVTHLIPFLKTVYPYVLEVTPLLLNISLFSIIYVAIPNSWKFISSKITAGVIVGCIFQIWLWVYFLFQNKISSYSLVYGTFAALPLFLIWLYVSWQILLAGAELAFSLQKRK